MTCKFYLPETVASSPATVGIKPRKSLSVCQKRLSDA